ncbi:MAG: hypothetical protein MK212_16695 [Saprospiraceae bacterium]|nr:hypothetical protein [Saprospiraceae bacterium]
MNFNKLLLSSLLFCTILFMSACGSDNDKPVDKEEVTLGKDNLYGEWICIGATYDGNSYDGMDTSTVLMFSEEKIESEMFDMVLGTTSSKYDFKDMKIIIPNREDPLFDVEVFEKEKIVLSMIIKIGSEQHISKSTWSRKK